MPQIRITVDGRLALTIGQAAQRKGVEPATMRQAIRRMNLQPVGSLDGRTDLYAAADLDAAWSTRPGKGANLRRDWKG